MGLFCVHRGDDWTDHLDALIGNAELLKRSPKLDYLFGFIEASLELAKEAYYKEKETQ